MSYICAKCKRTLTIEQLQASFMSPRARCVYCQSKILFKARPPVVRRVKAV
ncbi:MAG: DNA-directed RNA polymerase subunit P [Thermoproteota archaeon]|nr:MAG: DNA-directed RNA polymerase subunit P [Candidatus Korarchaeota archaeon]RLG56087.1 MAG: DNA-directed RNA polymerase subunit P [Candidatus Korarchaeota archaeon]